MLNGHGKLAVVFAIWCGLVAASARADSRRVHKVIVDYREQANSPRGAARVGAWSPLRTWPTTATHTHLLPTGNVMFLGEFQDGAHPARIWDPATDDLSSASPGGWNQFCSGHTFLEDGELLIVGGGSSVEGGSAFASLYDPFRDAWQKLPDMNGTRWYATATTLANGDPIVVSGLEFDRAPDAVPEILDVRSHSWTSLPGATRAVHFYPRQFAAPHGTLFVAGPDSASLWLDTTGTGSWTEGPRSRMDRPYGTAVMIDSKVFILGGNDPPTATMEVIDLEDDRPRWEGAAPMSSPRRQLNATILPDGTVLVTGGSSGAGFNNPAAAVLSPEIYDPDEDKWTTVAPMDEFRGYHSTALLLPDGRVFVGGNYSIDETAQVFSPPYLFKGSRPIIAAAPTTISSSTTFAVDTPHAHTIAKVALVRVGSVTHGFDMNQRYITLRFDVTSTGLSVRAPSLDRAPPGHYMLFILDRAHVPSVASIVQLTNGSDHGARRHDERREHP